MSDYKRRRPRKWVGQVALFDFDGTLIAKDSFPAFAKFALGRRRWWLGVLKSLPWLIGWKVGVIRSSKAKEHLFGKLYAGMDYGEFCRKGEMFADRVTPMMRHKVRVDLSHIQMKGVPVVVVTASMLQWVAPWAETFGIKKVIATEPEVGDDGRLTGRFATPNCKGKEKVARIRAEFPDIDNMEVFAWGNLPEDKWMFRLAIESHIV